MIMIFFYFLKNNNTALTNIMSDLICASHLFRVIDKGMTCNTKNVTTSLTFVNKMLKYGILSNIKLQYNQINRASIS